MGSYKVTRGLLDRFGDRRVIDSPITEAGFTGLTVGAALAGLHPVVCFVTFFRSLHFCRPKRAGGNKEGGGMREGRRGIRG